MFRLTFLLLAVIGIAMLAVGNDEGGRPAAVAERRVVDPALLVAPKPVAVAAAEAVDYGRPASVDRLLGVAPRPAVPRAVEPPVVAASLRLEPEAAAADAGSVPPRARDFLSVNDEVAARATSQAERRAAVEAASDEAVREGVDAALAEVTVATVTGNRVNVRSGPSTDYGVVGQVAFGEAAEVLSGSENGWVRIRIQGDGVEGYVSARFLDGSGINR